MTKMAEDVSDKIDTAHLMRDTPHSDATHVSQVSQVRHTYGVPDIHLPSATSEQCTNPNK
jgi:hypothetical protein